MKKWSVLSALFLVVLCLLVCHAESTIDPESIAVGDVITFGSYEQDNNLDNGPEPIEWIVLDVQDGKALLLSKYALDTKPYNTVPVEITWEKCSLRSWLNEEFLNAAFSEEETEKILMTHVDNSDQQGNGDYGISGGQDSDDRVFLLSYHESFELNFLANEDRQCIPTYYAVANGAEGATSGKPSGMWWLRSPGEWNDRASSVYRGELFDMPVSKRGLLVRPVLWVSLEYGLIP